MKKIIAAMLITMFSANVAEAKIDKRIISVQDNVNNTIRYQSDTSPSKPYRDSWDIPTVTGDCEDFALLKRQKLINLGWDANDIKIVIVSPKAGSGKIVFAHAVIYIESLKLVMDNPIDSLEYRPKLPIMTMKDYLNINELKVYCEIDNLDLGDTVKSVNRCKKNIPS